ncbi:S8 family serine peptidase [Streptomyces canus]|uniref:S8 family serine peptidase n=1 Tax=Streptomyces canus TaxID=58343 RepID=UPI00036CA7DE|nr:S8 family serine peptidase [Streptomyces canus]
MKPPTRGARLLCGTALAAGLLLPLAVTAHAAPRADPPAATGGQELPPMPASLDPDAQQAQCTPASKEKARTQDWSRQRLDLDRLHQHTTGGGVTVALIGTGVAPQASGLDGRVTVSGSAGEDCVGYGTFLAGLIAGNGGDSPKLAGVAPGAKILGLRGTDQLGRGSAAQVAAALREASQARADVIAVTVALPDRDPDLTRAVAEARAAGAVVVAAAAPEPARLGTDETPVRTYWPAGEPGVLAVADMLPSGARPDGSLPAADVDLVAPGVGVVSGGPRGTGHYLGAGAAVATAYAAGAAAVVRAAYPDESAEAVVHRLTATAYPADIPQLDPYAAVTTVLGDPGTSEGAEPAAEPVTVRDTSAADRTLDRATLALAVGSVIVLVMGWGAFALRRARARQWRPAAGTNVKDDPAAS